MKRLNWAGACAISLLSATVIGCASLQDSSPVAKSSSALSGASSPQAKEESKTDNPRAASEQLKIQQLSLREESGQTIIQAKFSAPVSEYRHFPVSEPPRIVLDVLEDRPPSSEVETFHVNTQLVGAIRVSSGVGYLRLTVETKNGPVPAYNVVPESGGLKIVIGRVDPAAKIRREFTLVRSGKRVDTEVPTAGASKDSDDLAGPQSASLAETKKYTGQKLSLDFKDADIKNVFRLLADVSGLNIVVTNDVNRKVTLRLVEVPWDQALDLLIETNGLGKEQIGNVVRISTAGQLKIERDQLAAAKKAEENLEPLQTVYFNINYAKVKDLEPKIKTLLTKQRPDASLVVDERSNTIMVRDVKKVVEDVRTLVAKLDTRTPQVLIESNLVEATPTFSRALGMEIDFSQGRVIGSSRFLAGSPFAGSANSVAPPFPVPSSGFRFGYVPANLNAFISAAENEGTIKIISRPSVVTLNNVASTIRSERILRIALPTSTNIASGTGASAAGSAVATEKVPVGIILTVTPQVSSDGYVLLNISVKSSTIAPTATVGGGTAGVIPFDELNREAIANVLVKDGETIVIGGILKDTAQDAESGVPYLKNIPILGWLFKNHTWQKDFEELMVFITPRVSAAGSDSLPTAEQLWRDQMKKTDGNKATIQTMNP